MHCVILRHLLSLPLYLGVMVGEMLLEISHGPFGFISKKVLITPYLFSFWPHHPFAFLHWLRPYRSSLCISHSLSSWFLLLFNCCSAILMKIVLNITHHLMTGYSFLESFRDLLLTLRRLLKGNTPIYPINNLPEASQINLFRHLLSIIYTYHVLAGSTIDLGEFFLILGRHRFKEPSVYIDIKSICHRWVMLVKLPKGEKFRVTALWWFSLHAVHPLVRVVFVDC